MCFIRKNQKAPTLHVPFLFQVVYNMNPPSPSAGLIKIFPISFKNFIIVCLFDLGKKIGLFEVHWNVPRNQLNQFRIAGF